MALAPFSDPKSVHAVDSVAIMLLVTVICVSCNPTKPTHTQIQLQDLQGYWLEEGYLTTLRRTRSPYKAAETLKQLQSDRCALWIHRSDHVYVMVCDLNFHESWDEIIGRFGKAKSRGRYRFLLSQPDQPFSLKTARCVPVRFGFDASGSVHTLDLHGISDHGRDVRFVRIPLETGDYANRVVLAGTYVDQKGRVYTFTQQGKAIWPDRSFKYSIAIDTELSDCDYIDVEGKDPAVACESLAYEWQGDRLTFFKVRTDTGSMVLRAKKPLFVLTRRK